MALTPFACRRYERCRARLETSQEHLADLNDRFNELRAEVEVGDSRMGPTMSSDMEVSMVWRTSTHHSNLKVSPSYPEQALPHCASAEHGETKLKNIQSFCSEADCTNADAPVCASIVNIGRSQKNSNENAEQEAGEASDALAAAKMEIQRLRGVLGTNDAAAALETATAKVSSLSEELHAARCSECFAAYGSWRPLVKGEYGV